MELTYKRILLKISGEVLAGGKGMGIDYDTVLNICSAVKECVDMGVQVGLVVGGGNFWRGRSSGDMDRTRADHMGMLATVMNSLALADALEHLKVPVRVQTAIAMQQIAEPYIRNKAVRHLEKGRVVIFGCGTGNPFFSTDTAVALRAIEMQVDAILMAKNIDGVYTADPHKDPNATLIKDITYQEALQKGLKVMDAAAFALCAENHVPMVRVFGLDVPENLISVLEGSDMGTFVHP